MRNPFFIFGIVTSLPAESVQALTVAAVFAVPLIALAWIVTFRICVRRQTRFLQIKLAEQIALREHSESASKVKGEFLAHMSHEIRTPMNAIIGFTDLVLKTQLRSRNCVKIWIAYALPPSGLCTSSMMCSSVAGSKLGADFNLTARSSPTAECIRSTIKIIQREAAAKNLSLHCKIDRQIPALVRSDPTRLQQIVVNLLDNAVKFTTSGSIMVSAVLESKSADSVLVRISVADTGIGIPPGRQHSIFEPFRQADGSAISNPAGTGLGLAICRKLVTLFGGTIEIQSQLGAGSTFEFTAWFQKTEGSAELDRQSKIDRTAGARHLSILIAEDNAVNRRLATKVLESAGHQVTAASNGKQAAQLFAAESFDLVFMDIEMPEMDGLEATQAIRAGEPKGSHIPIYALTAHAMAGDREKCIAAGMDGYISKPIDVDEVLNIIAAVASAPPRIEAFGD